jgi:hypothetical protein
MEMHLEEKMSNALIIYFTTGNTEKKETREWAQDVINAV